MAPVGGDTLDVAGTRLSHESFIVAVEANNGSAGQIDPPQRARQANDFKHPENTRFTLLAWKCCGHEKDVMEDIVKLLDEWGNWNMLLKQEGPR